jgi:hypothetical protein
MNAFDAPLAPAEKGESYPLLGSESGGRGVGGAEPGGTEPRASSQDTCLHLDNGCGNRQAGALIQTE